MTELTFEEAKQMSIEKWEATILDPLLDKGITGVLDCGFCIKYADWPGEDTICGMCPLGPEGNGYCIEEYKKFCDHSRKRNKRWALYWARKVLQRVKGCEDPGGEK